MDSLTKSPFFDFSPVLLHVGGRARLVRAARAQALVLGGLIADPGHKLGRSTVPMSPPFLDSESLSHLSPLSAKAPGVSSIQSPVVYTASVTEQVNYSSRDTSQ